nr:MULTISPECIES: hypothetical protein [Protofrankia]
MVDVVSLDRLVEPCGQARVRLPAVDHLGVLAGGGDRDPVDVPQARVPADVVAVPVGVHDQFDVRDADAGRGQRVLDARGVAAEPGVEDHARSVTGRDHVGAGETHRQEVQPTRYAQGI